MIESTLERADVLTKISTAQATGGIKPEEAARLINAASNLKCKAALSVVYGVGLRVSEVVALKSQ